VSDGNAACKDHDLADVEVTLRIGFLGRNVDTADPGAIHAQVGDEIFVPVRKCDIHGSANHRGLCLRGRDDCLRFLQCDHCFSYSPARNSLGLELQEREPIANENQQFQQ